MTVADMTPAELYGLIFLAVFNIGLGLLGLHHFNPVKLERTGEKIMACAGLFAIFGLPLFIGLRLVSSLI